MTHFHGSDGSQAEHTCKSKRFVLKAVFPSLFESPDGEMAPKLKRSHTHSLPVNRLLVVTLVYYIHQQRG